MKALLLGLIVLSFFAQSCYKSGKMKIQNKVSSVTLEDIKWGDVFISDKLLPGESSNTVTIDKQTDKLPKSHKISFKMSSNGQLIYLETVDEFQLIEDDDKLFILDDNTKVSNPN